jgi:hypothetical protein
MASPQIFSVDAGDLVATTLENRSRKIADNLTNNNALLAWLKKSNTRTFSGGRELQHEVRYAANQTFMWYAGMDVLNTSLNDTMTLARYAIKQAALSVIISGLEELQNAGDEQMLDLLEQRLNTAQATFENQMSSGIYSDGTGWGGKQIGGVQLLVSKTPSVGIVGGIDRSQYAWWRNLAVNSTLDTRGAVSQSNIQSYFNTMCLSLKRNSDGVQLAVLDNNFYQFFEQSLQAIQRITGSDNGTLGFKALEYVGAGNSVKVVLDGGKNGQIPANTGYFLNPDYLFFRPHAKRNFKVIGGDRANTNQDAKVRLLAWAGNLTTNGPQYQGVLF